MAGRYADSDSDSDLEIEYKNDPAYWAGQVHDDIADMREQSKRSQHADFDAFYKKRSDGSGLSGWSRNGGGEGSTTEYGLFDGEAEDKTGKLSSTLGQVKLGSVGTDGQYGASLDYVVGKTKAKAGPLEFEATALEGSFSAGIGRNTGIMAREQVVGIEGRAGPVSATLGFGYDTGVRVGEDGVEVKFAGTGFSADAENVEVAFLGTKLKIPAPWNWF